LSHDRLFATIAHQRLVMLKIVGAVNPAPAAATEVAEASVVATEDRSWLHVARAAQRVLEVRIDLDFLGKLLSLDVDERGLHGAHVRLLVVERDAARADWILEFVGVDADVRDATEQIVGDDRQAFSREHAVKCANEHGLRRIETLRWTLDVVAVRRDPRDDLHVLVAHLARSHLIVVLAALIEVDSTGSQEVFHSLVAFENDVEIALSLHVRMAVRRSVVARRPLDSDLAELRERLDQALISDVPWDATEEHLGRVDWILYATIW